MLSCFLVWEWLCEFAAQARRGSCSGLALKFCNYPWICWFLAGRSLHTRHPLVEEIPTAGRLFRLAWHVTQMIVGSGRLACPPILLLQQD